MSLNGRRIIVTGGASGIGESTVRALAAAGAKVASLDVNAEAGAAVASAIEPTCAVRFFACDITDRTAVEATFDGAAAWMGGVDGLINVAGVQRRAPAEEITDDIWEFVLAVNARGTMLTNQAAFAHMRERGGAIVNFASAAGATGLPGSAHYAASKGAVLAWTRTVAVEWARYSITVNAIAPAMWTPMYEQSRSTFTPKQLAAHDRQMAAAVPLGGKLGDPERDLGPALVFLVGDGARFITGQTIAVDGGLMMVR